jgi:glutathione S-transferase
MEELGIKDYKLITMPFPPRVFYKKFLEINRLGTIPFFEIEEDDIKMTESVAICQYLVDKYDDSSSLSIKPNEKDYGNYLNWLSHSDATLTFPQTVVLRYTQQEIGRSDLAAQDYSKWYIARLRMLDNVLSDGREFLCGNRFTIADISITFALYLGTTLEVDDKKLDSFYKPQTKDYMKRMISRQSFKSAQLSQDKSALEF